MGLRAPLLHRSSAFSLVELSIVLVILGLLVGGVLSGQALIQAAQLRSVMSEETRFVTAMHSFRDKYFALPGDLSQPNRFWPSIGTFGNQNGTIDMSFADGEYSGGSETGSVWPQLALANLVEGSYAVGASSATPGISAPAARYSPGVWAAAGIPSVNDFTNYDSFTGDGIGSSVYARRAFGNILMIGASDGDYMPTLPLFKPEDAYNIDKKMDDGKPMTGQVTGGFWNNLCSRADSGPSSATNMVASYRLDDTSTQCMLIFSNLP